MRPATSWAVLAWASCLLAGLSAIAVEKQPSPPARQGTIDFNRDIRPILSNNCLQCHGPDEKQRKVGLRLDTEEGALADRGGYRVIVRGKPDQSELLRRIQPEEPANIMPPKKTGKKLSPHEIDLLTRWVKQGAPYAKHWAYVKAVRPALPRVHDTSWPRNAIDHFILARLEAEGLKPSPEADRFALVRRVTLDLTGLPPTPEEVDAFVKDPAPNAYEKLVDRLLQKEAYGEHWARMWLDLARYADSAGYANDPPRIIWAYRDYVIRSFNANKPFDQFTIEQIAGDLLPNPTQEQLIATAFHRNTLTNSEGGTNDEEFRNVAIVDRVNTTLTVWMGTSIACAQCHTHKYDPILQKEYFQLFAFLNNTEDNDQPDERPVLSFFSEEQKQRRAHLEAEIAALDKKFKNPTPELLAAQAKWEATIPRGWRWELLKPSALKSRGGAAMTTAEGAVLVAGGQKSDTYTLEAPLPGSRLTALRLEALPHDSLPGKGPGHAPGGTFVVSGVTASVVPPAAVRPLGPVSFTAALADVVLPGFDAASVLNGKEGKKRGWSASGGKGSTLTLLPAQAVEIPAGSKLVVTIEQESQKPRHTLGYFRLAVTDEPRIAEFARLPAEIVQVLALPAEKREARQQAALTEYFLRNLAPELRSERDRLAALNKQLADLKPTTVPIMRELTGNNHRKTRIQFRGNFLDLGEQVSEGVPSVFPPLPKDAPRNRLTLAKWLMDENNPLTARVIANRYWEQIFGIGLVRSSEEFGSQGELPSHPELLDFLATELVHPSPSPLGGEGRVRGWDLKAFLKLLVTSAAYRQSSRVTPELVERDPDNRLLARGPRIRLSAEMVRDQALFVSGLLSKKMYGPSVKPPQPALGINAAFGGAIDWKTSEGEDSHRRGLYTEWRRTNPYPSLATFDAPNREVCTVRRTRTNTPLQALVTLNDTVFVEASQALGRRMAPAGPTPADRIRFGFRLCLGRQPSDQELSRLLRLYDQALATFKKDPDKAIQAATRPLGPVPPGADVAELASWTIVANVLLNLDEMFLKR